MSTNSVRPIFPRAARLASAALLASATPLLAQGTQAPSSRPLMSESAQSSLAFGFGMTSIDGKNYYLFNASPEFNLGAVGVGLDLNLRFDADSGRLRKEDWRNGRDAFKAIRFIRYGSKEAGSRFYARAGELDRATLGYGQIVYMYGNSPSYDARKRGAELGVDLGLVGFESMYSNLARPEITGGRAYLRPLSTLAIPVVSRLEIGASAVADFAKYAGLDAAGIDHGAPTVYGADVGLPLIANPLGRLVVYGDMAQIKDAGHGAAVGTQLRLDGMGLVHLSTRLEQRMLGDRYVPSYFNSFYELDRYNAAGLNGDVNTKTRFAQMLQMANPGNGMYGEIAGDVVNVLTLTGSYQRLYKQPNSGWLHLDAGTGDKVPNLVLKGSYDKWNVGNETGLWKLDANTLARLETGYRPNRFMTISLLTEWTFAPIRNGDDVIGYATQKRVEPKVSFGFAF